MPQHLEDHLAAGHHVPGIFIINLKVSVGLIIEHLILIAGACHERCNIKTKMSSSHFDKNAEDASQDRTYPNCY